MTNTIITRDPLNEDQKRVVDYLKEALALALEGKINAAGIALAMEGGYAAVIVGNKPAELMLAAFDLQCQIREATQGSAKTQATSRIIKGRMM